ncbi:MAG: hypothetical protein ACK5NF_03175 [Bacilli bacterium]
MPKIRIEVTEETMNSINNIKSELGLNSNQNGMAISHAISFFKEVNVMNENKFISSELVNVVDEVVEAKFKRLMPIMYELAVNSSVEQQLLIYNLLEDKLWMDLSNEELDSYLSEAIRSLKSGKYKSIDKIVGK